MYDARKWKSYHIGVRLDQITNEDAERQMPWCRSTANARLAIFLNKNGILPGEIIITEHHVNNGGMQYYALMYSDRQIQDFERNEHVQIFDA